MSNIKVLVSLRKICSCHTLPRLSKQEALFFLFCLPFHTCFENSVSSTFELQFRPLLTTSAATTPAQAGHFCGVATAPQLVSLMLPSPSYRLLSVKQPEGSYHSSAHNFPTASNLRVKVRDFTTAHKAEHKLASITAPDHISDYSLPFVCYTAFMASLQCLSHSRHAHVSGLVHSVGLSPPLGSLKWFWLRSSWLLFKIPTCLWLSLTLLSFYILFFSTAHITI